MKEEKIRKFASRQSKNKHYMTSPANSKFGLYYTPWYVVCGMWYVVYGIWYMVYGIWSWPVMSCNACFYCKTKRKTYTYSKRQGYIFILNICFPISVNGYFTFNNMFDRSKNEKRHQGPALLSYWVCPIMCILGPSLPPHPPILPKTQIKAIMHNLFNDYIGFPNHPLVRPKRNRTACTISPKGEAKTFEPCVPSVP